MYLPDGVYTVTDDIIMASSTELIGASRDGTILRLNPANISDIVFILYPKLTTGWYAANVKISNLTLDGNYDNLGSHPGNRGGLISPVTGWTVDTVVFNSSNSFMFFPNGFHNITVKDSIFRGNGSGADCIGGGGNTNLVIDHNVFEAGLKCNEYDNV